MGKNKNRLKKKFDSEPVQYKNIQKLKYNPIIEKSTQIFTMVKYKEKVLNLFVYQ